MILIQANYLVIFGWLMGRIALLDDWRSTSLEFGGWCVMTDLVRQKPQWRVSSLDSLIIVAMEMSVTHGMSGIYHDNKCDLL